MIRYFTFISLLFISLLGFSQVEYDEPEESKESKEAVAKQEAADKKENDDKKSALADKDIDPLVKALENYEVGDDMSLPVRIFWYFGVIGVTSIGLYILALALSLFSLVFKNKTRILFLSTLIGIAGFVTAQINSDIISSFEVDILKEKELESIRDNTRRQKEEEARYIKESKAIGSSNKFAEESVKDFNEMDKRKNEKSDDDDEDDYSNTKVYEEAINKKLEAEKKKAKGELEPAYKLAGKKKRVEGKVVKEKAIQDAVKVEEKDQGLAGRPMLRKDKYRADDYDRVNYSIAKWISALALLAFLISYVLCFNVGLKTLFPLPFAGPWMDFVREKTFTYLLVNQQLDKSSKMITTCVRRGENFIYYGEDYPLEGELISRVQFNWGSLIGRVASGIAYFFHDIDRARAMEQSRYLPIRKMGEWYATRIEKLTVKSPKTADIIDITVMCIKRGIKRIFIRAPFLIFVFIVSMLWVPYIFNIHAAFNNTVFLYYFVTVSVSMICMLFVDHPFMTIFLPVKAYRYGKMPENPMDMFDSAWFGREAYCVHDESLAVQNLFEFCSFLQTRAETRARTFRCLNIVWDFPKLPPQGIIDQLTDFSQAMNVRFILIASSGEYEQIEQSSFQTVEQVG
ncbi:MAG: hypothetical protein HRT89_16240 [Lentisphaeria bacterium]|nr:hypothetical protein [Lentisphaeria bacterium]NQZ69609.1 hypothetical protein [Lentisphaeria bacterium]